MQRKALNSLTALFLTGCGGFGVDFTDDRTIAIQKSPYLIVTTGDLTEKDSVHVGRILSFLSTQPYRDDNFTAFKIIINDTSLITNNKETNIDIDTKETE